MHEATQPLGIPDGITFVGGPGAGDGPESAERKAALERALQHEGAPPPPPVPERRARQVIERAFPALAENVRDYAIFLMDAEGVITFWGEGARYIKWWMRREAEGAHLRLLYPDGGAEDGSAEEHLRRAVAEGEYVGEGSRVRRDGSTFWAGVTLTALRDQDGELLGFTKVTRDLTARRAADAALERAAAAERALHAAEAVSAARAQFVSTLSHEVRTPIQAIMAYAELLEKEVGGPLTDQQRRFVSRMQSSARHLLALVEDELEVARLDAERAAPQGEAVIVGEVVTAALNLVEPQAHKAGVRLQDDTATTAARLACWGREERVRQILINLLANALKYAQPCGTEPPTVTVSTGTANLPPTGTNLPGHGPWVFVRVEDTGPGVPEAKVDTIFEPFVQLGRSEHHIEGAGLGLAISRRYARQMHGDISLDTLDRRTGSGAVFSLWLPMAPLDSLRAGGA